MKIKITESQNRLLQEKLMLKNWKEYCELVAEAYDEAPDYEPSAVPHWAALNKSNYEWFNKIVKKVNLIFEILKILETNILIFLLKKKRNQEC